MAMNKPFGQNVEYKELSNGVIVFIGDKGTEGVLTERVSKLQAAKKEASKLVSMANKRIKRLEANDFKDTPAYKMYIEHDGRFSVAGKDWNQLQRELARLRGFINAKTSTIKGAHTVLKEMAENIGVSYKNMRDLKAKSAKFFEIANGIEEWLRRKADAGSAIGYQKIWEAINEYTTASEIDLSKSEADLDGMLEAIGNELLKYPKASVSSSDSNFWDGWNELK